MNRTSAGVSLRAIAIALGLGVMLADASVLLAQVTGSVRGQVRSEDGTPIAGAQVMIEGMRLGGVTNADGRYTIQAVPEGTHTVVAVVLGYGEGRESNVAVTDGEASVVDFQLRTEVLGLAELVVTGVTEATSRARLPFTVARVGSEAMPIAPKAAIASVQGRVAGVTVVQNSSPGGNASIQLRSPTSINRENTPLIVVDGAILGASSVDISALDMESVEVVKGAAAASLYGSRAAAGVLQIRTHRGSSLPQDRTRFLVRSEFGSNDIPNPIQWARQHPYRMNGSGEFLNDQGDAVPRTQAAQTRWGFQDQSYPGATYDHINSLFDPGSYVTHSVSLGHNGGATSWLATGSYHNTAGVVLENAGYERGDFRVNLDHRLRNDLNFSASLFHLRSRTEDMYGNVFFDFIHQSPDVNLLQPDPDGTPYHFQPDDAGIRANPLYQIATQDRESKRQRTLASVDMRYNPLAWVAVDVNASYDRSDREANVYIPQGVKTPDQPDGDPGSLSRSAAFTNQVNASAGISASRDLGRLRARMVARALLERTDDESITASGSFFSVGGLPRLNALLNQNAASTDSRERSSGYFLTTDADYDDRYIVSALVRRDGSSLFGPEERWHTYYRASGAWRMAAEAWWPVPAINEFKVRYSRGTAGGRPNFADRFEVFTIQGGGGLELTTLGNRFLKPEKATEQEFGVDMVALGRVSLQLTYATQTTRDQLIQVPLPRLYGFTTQWQNAGTIDGHTYEGTVEARLVDRSDLRWSATLVTDRSRNKIVEYDRPCHTTEMSWRCAGETLGMMYGQKFLTSYSELPAAHANSRDAFQVNDDGLLVPVGVGNSWRDGVSHELWHTNVVIDGVSYDWGRPIKLQDEEGQDVRVRIGDANPDFKFGVANDIQWKGLNFYVLFDGQVGGDVYNATKQRMYQYARHADVDQLAKPEDQKKPSTYYSGWLYNANSDVSWFVEDGSYVKLREVSLRYGFDALRFPPLSRVGLERATLSLAGRNLHTWTRYSGYDPEIGSAIDRIDNFNYPVYRTITASVEIVF